MENETACMHNLDIAEWSLIYVEMIEMSKWTNELMKNMNEVKEKICYSILKI